MEITKRNDYTFVTADEVARIAVDGSTYPLRRGKIRMMGEDISFALEACRDLNDAGASSMTGHDASSLPRIARADLVTFQTGDKCYDDVKLGKVPCVDEVISTKDGDGHEQEVAMEYSRHSAKTAELRTARDDEIEDAGEKYDEASKEATAIIQEQTSAERDENNTHAENVADLEKDKAEKYAECKSRWEEYIAGRIEDGTYAEKGNEWLYNDDLIARDAELYGVLSDASGAMADEDARHDKELATIHEAKAAAQKQLEDATVRRDQRVYLAEKTYAEETDAEDDTNIANLRAAKFSTAEREQEKLLAEARCYGATGGAWYGIRDAWRLADRIERMFADVEARRWVRISASTSLEDEKATYSYSWTGDSGSGSTISYFYHLAAGGEEIFTERYIGEDFAGVYDGASEKGSTAWQSHVLVRFGTRKGMNLVKGMRALMEFVASNEHGPQGDKETTVTKKFAWVTLEPYRIEAGGTIDQIDALDDSHDADVKGVDGAWDGVIDEYEEDRREEWDEKSGEYEDERRVARASCDEKIAATTAAAIASARPIMVDLNDAILKGGETKELAEALEAIATQLEADAEACEDERDEEIAAIDKREKEYKTAFDEETAAQIEEYNEKRADELEPINEEYAEKRKDIIDEFNENREDKIERAKEKRNNARASASDAYDAKVDPKREAMELAKKKYNEAVEEYGTGSEEAKAAEKVWDEAIKEYNETKAAADTALSKALTSADVAYFEELRDLESLRLDARQTWRASVAGFSDLGGGGGDTYTRFVECYSLYVFARIDTPETGATFEDYEEIDRAAKERRLGI